VPAALADAFIDFAVARGLTVAAASGPRRRAVVICLASARDSIFRSARLEPSGEGVFPRRAPPIVGVARN